jgi:serine/threonine protein kinase
MTYLVAEERIRLGKRIAKCRSSALFRGKDVKTGEQVAVKLEPKCTRHPQLQYEVKVHLALAGVPGVPQRRWSGDEQDFRIMVMDLVGPSLERLFQHLERSMALENIVGWGLQVLKCVEHIHARGFVHRDVRPDVFMVGRLDLETVYVAGLALARRYRQRRSGEHVSCDVQKTSMWNVHFASANSHLGMPQSRRDDLESVGYMLIYFFRGLLPWMNLPTSSKHLNPEVLHAKTGTSLQELCAGCPSQMQDFMLHCRTLGFKERPDYERLRGLLASCLEGPHRPVLNFASFVNDWKVTPKTTVADLTPTCAPSSAPSSTGTPRTPSSTEEFDLLEEHLQKNPDEFDTARTAAPREKRVTGPKTVVPSSCELKTSVDREFSMFVP